MTRLYEKINKSADNLYGLSEIREGNPFLDGPCIITILPHPGSLKEINGSLRQVADLVNPDIDISYDIDRKIFGLGFGIFDENTQKFKNPNPSEFELLLFLSHYIFPLFIVNDDEKIDVYQAMKNMRNLTILTYCDGARIFRMIEEVLTNTMREVGYTETEIKMIMSQVCIASIGTNYLKNYKTNALAFSFGDVSDREYRHDNNTTYSVDKLGHSYVSYDSSLGFAVSGDGNHDFKRYMTEDETISPYIRQFLNTSLDNAIENRDSEIFNPITYEKMSRSFDVMCEDKTLRGRL